MCRSFCMGGYRGKTALFLFFLLPPCTLHSRSAKSGGPVKVRSSACGKVVDEWLTLSCAVSSFQTSALPSCRKYSLLPRKRTNLSFCFLYAILLQFFFIILNPIFWFFSFIVSIPRTFCEFVSRASVITWVPHCSQVTLIRGRPKVATFIFVSAGKRSVQVRVRAWGCASVRMHACVCKCTWVCVNVWMYTNISVSPLKRSCGHNVSTISSSELPAETVFR